MIIRGLQHRKTTGIAPCKQQIRYILYTSSRKQYSTTTSSSDVMPPPPDVVPKRLVPFERYLPLQPPSLKPAELRKTQLHRQYTSLLRSSPLILIFQHNNLRAPEFASIRRELTIAMRKVDSANTSLGEQASKIRLQVIQSKVFAAALRVVEFFDRENIARSQAPLHSSQGIAPWLHDSSLTAHRAAIPNNSNNKGVKAYKRSTKLHAMLSGPITILSFPTVSPQHLAAALSVLAPTIGPSSSFPAPKRKTHPSYYDISVQNGLSKLILLGAKIEGKAMDCDGTHWVGNMNGGINGIRAQLAHILGGVGMGLVRTLGNSSQSIWTTLEFKRMDMEGCIVEG